MPFIGDNTHISRNLLIYSCNHQYEGNCLPFDSTYIDKSVSIGKNVWIGMNVNIIPGVTIGDGAVIGMGVTVSKNVNSFEIIGNPPSRILKRRNERRYKFLSSNNQYGGINGKRLVKERFDLYFTDALTKGDDVFFVLGTGRSGSTAISKILSEHTDITCIHEPKLQLLQLSARYLHNEITDDDVMETLKLLFCESNVYPSGCYGESDQKLMPFIGQIASLLPQSKFIWLIRDARNTVNSTYSRGWFTDDELGFSDMDKVEYKLYREAYSDYRPHADKIGVMSPKEWRSISAFERNCWYWSYWNGEIEKALDMISPSRYMKIKLENLDSESSRITEFLGVEHENLSNQVTNQAEKRHKLHTQQDWTDKMKESFEKWCSSSDLYYNDGDKYP